MAEDIRESTARDTSTTYLQRELCAAQSRIGLLEVRISAVEAQCNTLLRSIQNLVGLMEKLIGDGT